MSNDNNQQRVTLPLLATLIATSYSVQANETESGVKSSVERIAVTGSRIQRQDMETASPVTVIDSVEIKAEGHNSVEEILQSQPAMAGMSIGSTTNNGSNGRATVNLRGMGVNRTLVLLNGRRMVNSGAGADSSVDLNTIPVALIKRVEILKDGASAVYGSDAIAGVVNIITKDDFDGLSLEVSGDTTASSHHVDNQTKGQGFDGQNINLSGLYGFNSESGNITLGASYQERKGIRLSDRTWVAPGASSFIPGGSITGSGSDADGNPTNRTLVPDFDDQGNFIGYRDRDPANDVYDYNPDTWLQTPSKQYSFFANSNHSLGSNLQLQTDLLYTKRQSFQRMAPQPASVELDVCKADGSNAGRCVDLTGMGIGANERGQVTYKRRMTDVGPRIYEQDIDTLRASAALSGMLDMGSGYDWEVSYTYGRNDAKSYVHNSVNAKNMAESIYNNQQHWFNGGPLSQSVIDDVSFTERNSGGNQMHIASAVISGDLFDTDAGAVGFASGIEYRHESGFFTPDAVIQRGEGTAAQQDATKGDYNVASGYVEVSAPITEALTGEFAIRHDHYNTFGGATTWKAGLTYEASDSLMFRSVAATGFRAPSVAELYGGGSGSYEYLTDPWGRAQDSQILVRRVSDPNLKPEKSRSFTLGTVFSPQSVDGLSFTLDYWQFDVKDAIARLDVQAGLDACYNGDQNACDIHQIGPDGDLRTLTNPLTNVGEQNTKGIDFNTQYTFTKNNVDWSINNDLTRLLEFKQDGKEYTGTIGQTYGAFAKYKNNFRVTARLEDWSFNYSNRFIGEMTDFNSGDTVGSIMYHNVSASWYATDSIVANFGIKNPTDELPRHVSNGNTGGTVPEVYNTIGRQIFAGVNITF
ncbi:TonB-dependent receptor plug domain-containing protein [Paraferrimonas haliotis]|uniref:TonB-dependent receptor n=1 Tax=Paraferrimonas haliotis TaxID=2013866 RepID=A0AA37X025_9GAMM|nr:TonB-dependent receptor [Paraferrimonas haliotis]GLS84516.1 TonB-dependent receptor [Paraferrimonas haliotis]